MGKTLFGGSDTVQNNQSESSVWSDQSPYLNDIYGRAQELSTTEQPIAGFNDVQVRGQNAALDYANGQGGNIFNNTMGALNFGLKAPDVNNNPYLQKAVNSAIRPLTQNYQENVLSNIEDKAIASGQYGSSRHGVADGIAARSYMDSVGDITSNMYNNAYGQGLNTMMQSINSAPTVQNMGLFKANTLQNVGGQIQGMEQQKLDSPWNNLNRFNSMINAPVVLNSSTGSSNTNQRNGLPWG